MRAAAGLFLVALAGCGGQATPTYPAAGKVVAPGGAPWPGGRVTLDAGDRVTWATGDIGPDGAFALTAVVTVAGQVKSYPGAAAGEYTVTLQAPGGKLDRDGQSTAKSVTLPKKLTVEPKANSLTIEAALPDKP